MYTRRVMKDVYEMNSRTTELSVTDAKVEGERERAVYNFSVKLER